MPRDDDFEVFGTDGWKGDDTIAFRSLDDGSDDDGQDDRSDDGPDFDDPSDDDVGFDDPSDDDASFDDPSDDDAGFDDRSDDGAATDDRSDDGRGSDDRSDDDRFDDRSDDGPLGIQDVLKVAYLYEAVLNRDGAIDLEGFNFWIDAREQGLSERGMAEQFLFSNEFRGAFGDPDDLEDRELVELCYRNILDRDADDDGIAFWAGALRSGDFGRADLLIAFVSSGENTAELDYDDTLIVIGNGDWGFA